MARFMSVLRDDSPFSHRTVRPGRAGAALDGAALAEGAGAVLAGAVLAGPVLPPAAAATLPGAGPACGATLAAAKTNANRATGARAPMPTVRPTSRLAGRDKTSRPGTPGA